MTANVTDESTNRLARKIGCLVFIVACVIRLGAGFLTGRLLHPELFEYEIMAKSLLAGAGLSYTHQNVIYHSFAPPLYAWLSALSYWIFGSQVPLMIGQAIAGAGLAVVSAAIAKRLYPGWIAPLAAGLLIAFHPGLIVYNIAKGHPLTFDALFFALALLQAFRLRERTTVRRAIEFGLILGTGALCRATLIIFLPLAALWLVWVARTPSVKRVIQAVVIAGICTTAIVIPWTVRCTLLHQRFVFMVTTDAESFWRGNNPNATGAAYATSGKTLLQILPSSELADLQRQPDELAQADWFRARSHAFIREHPVEFLRLTALKLFHFWWLAPQTGLEYPKSWFIGYAVYYLLIVLCAVIGGWRIWRTGQIARQQLILIIGFLFTLSLLQSLYYVEGRHRWAVEPILIAISGGGVAAITRRRRQKAPLRAS